MMRCQLWPHSLKLWHMQAAPCALGAEDAACLNNHFSTASLPQLCLVASTDRNSFLETYQASFNTHPKPNSRDNHALQKRLTMRN
jgi:hypothetical protein